MAVNRHEIFTKAMRAWVEQYMPEINLRPLNYRGANNSKSPVTWGINYYDKDIAQDWHPGVRQKENIRLFDKMEYRKVGSTMTVIFTTPNGERYGRPDGAKKFELLVPKRQISDVAKLRSRYRRGVITYPAAIKKMEDSIAEQTLELPILEEECKRLDRDINTWRHLFTTKYGIKLKPYPYVQSITSHLIKLGVTAFADMKEAYWQIRHGSARLEDLHRRRRIIHRQVRGMQSKIAAKREDMRKLTHGSDPKTKKSWEK